MAKLGEQRRWRITFVWENGVRGTQTTHSEENARRREAELLRNAENRGMAIKVTVSQR